MPPEDGIEPGFVDGLLALSTREQQTNFLRSSGLLDAAGLDRLLGAADKLLNSDPGKAQRLAELCRGLADEAGVPAAVPHADYILVQTHFINGEFDVALRFVDSAYRGYMALGDELEALRTNIGRMALLLEQGHYREALRVGQFVLDALDKAGEASVTATPREAGLLIATVHLNRGGCYEYMGLYQEALDAYTSAEEGYRNLGVLESVGEVLDNRGAVLSYLGRGAEALAAHEAAAAIFKDAGLTLLQAMSLGNIGETHLRLANYTEGLNAFGKARRLLSSLDASADEYLLLRDTADAYLSLNLYSEALTAYREANSQLRDAGMSHDRARTLWSMGSAMIAELEFKGAEEVLAEAAKLFSAAGNVPMLSGVMLEQASLSQAQGDHEAALAKARRALEVVSEGSWPVQQVYAQLRLSDLLLPDVDKAEPHLLAAQRLTDRLALPQLSYRLNERLGRLRRLQGHDEKAQALLEEAVDEIERMRGAVVQDAMRASFVRDKTAAYEDLLLLHLAGEVEEAAQRAFAVAERAKSRALVDLLTGVAEREPMRSADAELEKRVRTSQADLNAVYSELLGGRGDEAHPVPITDLRERAAELEQEISQLRLQAATVDHDPFVPSMPSDGIQNRLPSDTVLVAYHTAGDEILAFVNAHGRIRVARHLGTVEEVERLSHKLDIQWSRFRAGREFTGRHMAMLERSARQVLGALYEKTVAPLEPLLEEAVSFAAGMGSVPNLAVVPHGPLHRIPFHALFDGGRYLIERFEISYAPSATVYALCQDRELSGKEKALVFGIEDSLIPSAGAEAHAVAERLPSVEMRVGESATVEALREETSGCGVLHLACHGLFRSDNPMFSSLKLHDGWLMAADAMSLDLPGALVTLSACESGRGEVIGGDEVLGLTRAFLGAGAATLVVSLWLVQDETTADLMGRWYGRLRAGAGRAPALRAAQLEIKEGQSHPYYWAPFVLIGKR